MPQINEVHIDSALTNVSVQYGRNEYIANALFPLVPVARQSGKFFRVDDSRDALRQSDDVRAAGGEALEADFGADTGSYFCEDHALQAIVPDEERANADPAIQADIDKVEFLTGKILLNKEIALAGALASGVTNSHTIDNAWNDYADGDPIGDVSAAIQTVIGAAQTIPNTLVIDYAVYLALKDHPDLVDRVQFASGGQAAAVTRESLAQVFGLERVLIGRSFKNTAARGQSASVSSVWGDTAYVAYVPAHPGLRRLALGYTFAWNNGGAASDGRMVEQWRNDARRGEQVRVSFYYDQHLVAPAAACKLANTLA